jgi:hypothetical protein
MRMTKRMKMKKRVLRVMEVRKKTEKKAPPGETPPRPVTRGRP